MILRYNRSVHSEVTFFGVIKLKKQHITLYKLIIIESLAKPLQKYYEHLFSFCFFASFWQHATFATSGSKAP